jgi:AbrB family looped-hinge helix DNA binding protein
MAATGVVSTKGQVTIPHEVRQRLGLKEGDRVEFITEGGVTIIRPARTIINPFEEFAGALGTFPGGKEEINAWVADLRNDN